MVDHTVSKLQAALSYAALGWRVFPLKPLSKEPLLHQSWPQIATTEAWQIVEWWTEYPDANIAVVADGELLIIDVDRKKDKPDGWQEVGNLIDTNTPWVSTPHQGYHFYYRNPNTTLSGCPGVDIIHGNHYVVAPPSTLPDGAYAWGLPPAPWDNIAVLPFELALRLYKSDVPRETIWPWESDDLPTLTDQHPSWDSLWARLKPSHQWFLHNNTLYEFPTRSELCFSLIRRLYRLGLKDDQLLSLLWSNPYVQTAYLDKRQDSQDKALRLLWQECKKLRHLRQPSVEEVFGKRYPPPVMPQAVPDPEPADVDPPPAYEQLRDEAQRFNVGMDNVHPFLQKLATAELGPIERDLVIEVLKNQGYPKDPLRKQLAQYEREVKAFQQTKKGIRWKDTFGEEERPAATWENLQAMLDAEGAVVRHNLMDHRIYLTHPEQDNDCEDKFNNQLTTVRSWAARHRLPLDTIAEQLLLLAQKNSYHPFKEFVEQHPWDGTNRVHRVMDTVTVPDDKVDLKHILMKKWFISIVAAVYGYGSRAPRGVLTFVGDQGIGKTTWLKYLVPEGMYHQGLLLRADNRDSATKGLRYLLCEMGEVGSTFRKGDLESLKAYIGQREDNWRLPYARDETIWTRRTIFAASANNQQLLQDQTGNTRWWVIPAEKFDLDSMEAWWDEGSGYEMQQFWAEVHLMYKRGDAWDLSDQELAYLSGHQERHMEETAVISAIKDTYQWETVLPKDGYPVPKRMLDIARDIGLNRPFSPSEVHEARHTLQRLTGQQEGVYRRISLATLDGKDVSSEWKDSMQDKKRQVSRPGRWWYVPHKVGEYTQEE